MILSFVVKTDKICKNEKNVFFFQSQNLAQI